MGGKEKIFEKINKPFFRGVNLLCTVLGAPGLDLPFSFRFQLVDCKGLLQENCELSPHSPSAFGFEIQPPTVGPKFPRFMMVDLATAIAHPFWQLRSKFFFDCVADVKYDNFSIGSYRRHLLFGSLWSV